MSTELPAATSLCVSLLVLALGILYLWYLRAPGGYPPGPKPHMLLGNLLEMPTEFEYFKFREWSNQYGKTTDVGRRLESNSGTKIRHVRSCHATHRSWKNSHHFEHTRSRS